jgi:hypothetical protein
MTFMLERQALSVSFATFQYSEWMNVGRRRVVFIGTRGGVGLVSINSIVCRFCIARPICTPTVIHRSSGSDAATAFGRSFVVVVIFYVLLCSSR